MRHWETHLYTYAYFVANHRGEIKDCNRTKMRAKCISKGHTEGECMLVEKNPQEYINNGFKRLNMFK